MALFSPRRFQPPFRPYRPSMDGILSRAFARVERWVKGPLFGCRMCGNCILQETAYVCPMTCPKGLRNGLCGGATPEQCEVDPSRPCTWYVIYERSAKLGHTERLLEIPAPLDGNRVGRETWLHLLRAWRSKEEGPRVRDIIFHRKRFKEELGALLYEVRQPNWWGGDAQYHAPGYEGSISVLEANLRNGQFVVTGEIAPPLGASPDLVREKAAWLKGTVAAANFTDNASASPRMSSMASSRICLEAGLEPIMQLQARDRNRVALESDAIGAAGLGIRNILCLSGDHPRFGPGPMARPGQFDMDAIQLLWMLRRMRDEGRYLDGRPIKAVPRFFLGAAGSPYGANPDFEALRAEKKVNAGAQFIQTQPVFDLDRFLDWLEALDKRRLLDKVHVLAGLLPLKSAGAANFMAREVPGVVIPAAILKRMTDAAEEDERKAPKTSERQKAVGFEIALELLQKIKEIRGIRGVHIMAVYWESIIPRLVAEAQLPAPISRES